MARPLLFISYRRDDTDAVAGRLRDRLLVALPDWEVFMDVDSIAPGDDFLAVIDRRVSGAALVLAVMGERWAGPQGKRILEPNDAVRREIAVALASGVRLLPVLVNGARMPAPASLPDDVASLASLNAIELRHTRFNDDFERLVQAISGVTPELRHAELSLRPRRLAGMIVGALGGAAAALAALVLHHEITGAAVSERLGDVGASIFIPALALLGALAGRLRR